MSSILRTLVFIWTRGRGGCEEEDGGPGRTLGFLLPRSALWVADLWDCLPSSWVQSRGAPTGDQRKDTE